MFKRHRFLTLGLIGVPLLAVAVKRRFTLTQIEPVDMPIDLPYPDMIPVKLQLDMPIGEIEVRPGGEALVSGQITYNVEEWEPRWTIKGGKVRLHQGDGVRGIPPHRTKNEWDLRLGASAPYSLAINSGFGQADLDLSGLPLTGLEINTGAGETEIRFDQVNPQQMRFAEVSIGAGEVSLFGLLNLNAERLEVSGGAGQLELNFEKGQLTTSNRVEVSGGAGEVLLIFNRDLPVRIRTSTGIGKVDASGLTRRNGGFETASYSDADICMDVEVSVGVGSVHLEAR